MTSIATRLDRATRELCCFPLLEVSFHLLSGALSRRNVWCQRMVSNWYCTCCIYLPIAKSASDILHHASLASSTQKRDRCKLAVLAKFAEDIGYAVSAREVYRYIIPS